jgi:hypothetical protein
MSNLYWLTEAQMMQRLRPSYQEGRARVDDLVYVPQWVTLV